MLEAKQIEEDVIASVKCSLNDTNAVTWDLVKSFTDHDESLQLLKEYIITSFPKDDSKIPSNLEPFLTHQEALAVVDGVILVGGRVLVPKPLCDTVCKILH